MSKRTKDILDIILGVLYVFFIIFCVLGYSDIIKRLFVMNFLSFIFMIIALAINININKIFKLKNMSYKIAYNTFFYVMILLLGVGLYFFISKVIIYNLAKILPILVILLSLIILIKDKDIKRPFFSILIFDIAIILGELMY